MATKGEHTKQKIIEDATRLFHRKGFGATSVSQRNWRYQGQPLLPLPRQGGAWPCGSGKGSWSVHAFSG